MGWQDYIVTNCIEYVVDIIMLVDDEKCALL